MTRPPHKFTNNLALLDCRERQKNHNHSFTLFTFHSLFKIVRTLMCSVSLFCFLFSRFPKGLLVTCPRSTNALALTCPALSLDPGVGRVKASGSLSTHLSFHVYTKNMDSAHVFWSWFLGPRRLLRLALSLDPGGRREGGEDQHGCVCFVHGFSTLLRFSLLPFLFIFAFRQCLFGSTLVALLRSRCCIYNRTLPVASNRCKHLTKPQTRKKYVTQEKKELFCLPARVFSCRTCFILCSVTPPYPPMCSTPPKVASLSTLVDAVKPRRFRQEEGTSSSCERKTTRQYEELRLNQQPRTTGRSFICLDLHTAHQRPFRPRPQVSLCSNGKPSPWAPTPPPPTPQTPVACLPLFRAPP